LFGLIALLVLALVLPNSVSERARGMARETFSPLQGLISSSLDRLRNAGASIRGWGGLPEENRKIAEENLVLHNRVAELQRMEEENIRLRSLLGFQQRSRQQLVASEVIARDLSGWWRTVRLNRGFEDGIALDQAVVNAEGLVGKIISVSERTSDVLLVSDPNCRMSVTIQGQPSHGILAGKGVSVRGHAVCVMDLILKDLPVNKGAEVLTSGLGVFPKGWRVGYVDSVSMDASGLYQTADVLPAADLNDLQVVFVIRLSPALGGRAGT
jgi:rod shape-determining protein MreC